MDENKRKRVQGLMGLCVRARQAVFGEDGCMKSIRSGQCGALLLDAGASATTKEKYRGACERAEVAFIELPEGLLLDATGRPGVAMAVQKGGFSDQLIGLTRYETNEYANHGGGASVE